MPIIPKLLAPNVVLTNACVNELRNVDMMEDCFYLIVRGAFAHPDFVSIHEAGNTVVERDGAAGCFNEIRQKITSLVVGQK